MSFFSSIISTCCVVQIKRYQAVGGRSKARSAGHRGMFPPGVSLLLWDILPVVPIMKDWVWIGYGCEGLIMKGWVSM